MAKRRQQPKKKPKATQPRIERSRDDLTRQLNTRVAERTAELAESHRLVDTLMGNLPGMVYRCRNDRDWTMEFVSEGCLDLTGHPSKDLMSHRVSCGRDIIHPDDREAVWNDVQAALNERRPFRLNYRIVTRTGEEKRVWEQGRGVYGPTGELIALEGYITDVTDRTRAEEALHTSEQRLRALVQNCPDVIMRVDRNGTILFINYTLPIYTVEEVLGTKVTDYISAEDGRKYIQALNEVFDTGDARALELEAAGPTFWLVRLAPLRHHDVIESAMIIATDITKHRQAEHEVTTRARQQAVVAEFGQRALAGSAVETLMEDAVALVARVLDVEYAKVLKLLPDGQQLLLQAGIGWREGLAGHATVGAGSDSQAGYTLSFGQPVIVEDLRTETRFSGPPLLLDHGVVSGLSVVIGGEGQTYGVLGAHTAHRRSFNRDDVNFLQAIANVLMAAIQRKHAEEMLRQLAQGLSASTGEEFFWQVVKHLAHTLGVEYAFVGRLLPGEQQITTTAIWANDEMMSNFTYDIKGTPCEHVVGKEFRFYPTGVQQLFPDDLLLKQMGIESYVAAPLFDSSANALGHIGAMGRSPMHDGDLAESLLRIFAVRVSAELERAQAETTLVQLSSAVEQAADSVFITDRNGIIEYVNPAFERLVGYTSKEAVGQNARLLKSGRHQQRYYQELWRTILAGTVFRSTIVNRKKNGEFYYEEKTITPIKNRDGQITHFVSTGRDITERMRVEEARGRLAAIIEATPDFVGSTDASGRLLYINSAGRRMLDLGPDDPIDDLRIADCHPLWASMIVMSEGIPGAVRDGTWSGETALLSRDGREIPVSQVIIAHKALDGTISYLSTIARDISERKAQTAALEYQATHDALTDLPNRHLLIDRLQQAIRAGHRDNHPLALLILDLDRFKEINDTLGHHHGDLLLKEIGPRLRGALRESDTVARLGGDEFAMLLPTADRQGATQTAQKILEALERPFTLGELALDVEASIGIALFKEHGEDADTILRHADVAMYMAKQAGTGYALYASDHDQYSHRRLSLMGELRYAIERNQLFLHYQPTVDLKTGQVIGAEALLRWQHPKYGLVPPDQFIPLSEQTGLIKPLTDLVLDEALAQCRRWHEAGLSLTVSVNLSARSLHERQFPDYTKQLLQRHKLASKWLNLELTESAIMSDPDRAMEILSNISIMGVRLAIDDFGVGHSSLTYLKKLPVHEIKIDKSFVINMATDPDDWMIVRSIIDLGHNQGLKVVAEGVETQQVLDQLTELGCDSAQGTFLSRPISAEDFSRWVQSSRWRVAAL